MISLKCYFGVYFLHCFATQEIITKITLSWEHRQSVTPVHTLTLLCMPALDSISSANHTYLHHFQCCSLCNDRIGTNWLTFWRRYFQILDIHLHLISIKILWKLVPQCQTDNKSALMQVKQQVMTLANADLVLSGHMGGVMEVWLSCYLVLLSMIAKPGNKTATLPWPLPYGQGVMMLVPYMYMPALVMDSPPGLWFNIKKSHLTSIGNPIVEIKRSQDRLISAMGFAILVRWHIFIESGSRCLRT